jgi:electron transfer flavoprotein alpha subunit
MAGCLGAKHIVAINTDAGAPIISRAEYAVIGDLSEVIPALIAGIRQHNDKS